MTAKPKITLATDWHTPDPLKLTKTDKNFKYRWIRKNELELRRQQGWQTVLRDEVGLEKDSRVSRGETSVAECNELVLCKRPKAMGEAHRNYLDQKNKRLLDALGSQFHQEGERAGFSTYGSVTVEEKAQ
ncbi:MAG: hypothetical protein RBU23_12610 [Candidatus Auribacterota bacterium]|jgi:hypothetical protein|nr:hypothetical protein [Candidatus Auribacterota bacterium]